MTDKKQLSPLRKIISVVGGHGNTSRYLLECGHKVWKSSKTTYRARCPYCRVKDGQHG